MGLRPFRCLGWFQEIPGGIRGISEDLRRGASKGLRGVEWDFRGVLEGHFSWYQGRFRVS